MDSETQKLTKISVENLLKEQKDILTNRRASRLIVNTCAQRVKQKWSALCSAVIEINKE